MELMRALAFIALLLSGTAVGAELRQAEVCGNGSTHQSGYCPAVLSSPTGSQTGATTGTVSATSDESDGTRYACAASSATPLTCDGIESCSGGTAIAGSSAAETGSNSIALTGLTTDAAHYGQSCNESPEGWSSNVVVSSSFTPTAPATGDNQSRVQSAIAAATGQPFALPSQVSALQYPADPVTSGDPVEVQTNAELEEAISTGGRVIRIYGPANGGLATYDQFNLTVDDVDIVMDNDATISGTAPWQWFTSLQRIRWTGGNIAITGAADSDGFRIADAQDFLFDNVNMYKVGASGFAHVFQPQGDAGMRRFAVINSTIEQQTATTTNYYSVFSFSGTLAEASTPGTDIIWVNNLHVGVGPPVRLIKGGQRTVIVGNYYDYIGSSGAVRLHRNYDGVWFGYNYIPRRSGTAALLKFEISDDITSLPNTYMNDVLIENNNMFQDTGTSAYQFGDVGVPGQADQCTNWVVRGNRVHSTAIDPDSTSTIPMGGNIPGSNYTQSDDLVVGSNHADYITDPGQSGFGADH